MTTQEQPREPAPLCKYCGEPTELGFKIDDSVKGVSHRAYLCQNFRCVQVTTVTVPITDMKSPTECSTGQPGDR